MRSGSQEESASPHAPSIFSHIPEDLVKFLRRPRGIRQQLPMGVASLKAHPCIDFHSCQVSIPTYELL